MVPDVVGQDSGRVDGYGRNQGGLDAWGRVQTLIGRDTIGYDSFGTSVAIDGNAVLAGAPYDDDAGEA